MTRGIIYKCKTDARNIRNSLSPRHFCSLYFVHCSALLENRVAMERCVIDYLFRKHEFREMVVEEWKLLWS